MNIKKILFLCIFLDLQLSLLGKLGDFTYITDKSTKFPNSQLNILNNIKNGKISEFATNDLNNSKIQDNVQKTNFQPIKNSFNDSDNSSYSRNLSNENQQNILKISDNKEFNINAQNSEKNFKKNQLFIDKKFLKNEKQKLIKNFSNGVEKKDSKKDLIIKNNLKPEEKVQNNKIAEKVKTIPEKRNLTLFNSKPLVPKELENEEVQNAISELQYKISEINELIKSCIERTLHSVTPVTKDELLSECTGINYQILHQNYKDGLNRVQGIFFDIIRTKLSDLDPEYDDEIDFFFDILEKIIHMDFNLKEALEICKKTSKYYVSTRFFISLIEISETEINAFDEIHQYIKESRGSVKDLVNEKFEAMEEQIHEDIELLHEHEHEGDYYEGEHYEGENEGEHE